MSDQLMRAWLAFILMGMITFVLWALFFLEMPAANRETLNIVLGGLLAKLADVYGYSFGNSADATKLTHLASKQADTANMIAAAVPVAADAVKELKPGEAVKAPDPTPSIDEAEKQE